MKNARANVMGAVLLAGALLLHAAPVTAQSSVLAQKVQEVKQLMLVNQQQLSRYTWQMQQTVSVNGDVKKQDLYQVQIGSDGKQVRTLVAQPVAAQSNGRQHGIKHRMQENFEEYAQQVGDLAKSYAPPLNPAKIQQLYAQGSVALKSAGPGYSALVISNYNKSGDSITLVLSDNPKALYSINISSYLSGPSDAVTIQARFASLPDGTHYVSNTTVNGVSKNLSVVQQSMNFTPRAQ